MSELAYGIHSIKSILDNNPKKILRIHIICKPWDLRLQSLIYQISKYNICLHEHNRQWLNLKVKGAIHQGIIAEIKQSLYLKENELSNFLMTCNTTPLLLILDGITDPHNLGACLRSAEAAGVHMVIAPRNRSVNINSTVRKVSSGAADCVPFLQVTNLSRTLKLLQKYDIWIVGTAIHADRVIFDAKLVGPLALVMGSEGFGMRRLTKQNCDELINIPMLGSIMSLNISVATGICLFEALRQRRYQK